MMRLTWNITEDELTEAIAMMASKRGFRLCGNVRISVSEPDRPTDSRTFSASAEIEQVTAPFDPQGR